MTYIGETNARGEPHGQGIFEYKDGSRYEGQFKDGLIHGQGILEFANGDRYEGQWKDGKMHGQGILEFPSGNRYKGQWKDGKKHGRMLLYDDSKIKSILYDQGEVVSTETMQPMSNEDLTIELLKIKEKLNKLRNFDSEDSDT